MSLNDGDSDGDDLMDEDHVNDCGDNEHVYDGGDDDVIFNGHDEDRQPTRDRYSEMLSISKQLWSYLENCDDEYYQQVKKQTEQQVQDACAHVIAQTKSTNNNNGTLISCKPINNRNTTRKHKRQQTKY